MSTIWRRWCTGVGVALIAASALVPVMSAGADVGPVASTTAVVPYSCSGVGFAVGFGTLPTQNVTMTLGAPAEVTVGQQYVVTLDMSPLQLADAGFPIVAPATTFLAPVGGTGSAGGQAVSPNVSFAGATVTVPRSTMTVTPTAAAGGSVVLTAGEIRIVVGSTGFSCVPTAGATRATITTNVVSALTTTSTTPTSTSSTVPGETTTSTSTTTTVPATLPPPTTVTTTTTAPSPTTTAAPGPTTTTAAPPTTPAGPAVSVVSSATATFTCDIYDATGTKFNQNPLPPSTVTVIITLPDKVGVGGAVAGLVKLDPGPLNGPIKLNAGTVTFAAKLAISGGSPATVEATGGPNTADIAANTPAVSPNMPFNFTATAPAGDKVVVGVTEVEVRASSPAKLTTRCVPSGTAMATVASVAVVTGTVQAPADLTAQVEGASSGSTPTGSTTNGFANCAAAKAAGRGTIVKSDPAYRTWLDADSDGLACEANEVSSLALTGSSPTTPLVWSGLLLLAGAACLALGRSRRLRPALNDSGVEDQIQK